MRRAGAKRTSAGFGTAHSLGALAALGLAVSGPLAVWFHRADGTKAGGVMGGTFRALSVGEAERAPNGPGMQLAISNPDPSLPHQKGVACLRVFAPLKGRDFFEATKDALLRPATCSRGELKDRGYKSRELGTAVVTKGGCVLTSRHTIDQARKYPGARVFLYFGPNCNDDTRPGVEVTDFLFNPRLPTSEFDMVVGRLAGQVGSMPADNEFMDVPPVGYLSKEGPKGQRAVYITGYGDAFALGRNGARIEMDYGEQRSARTVLTYDDEKSRHAVRITDRGFVPAGREHEVGAGDCGGPAWVEDKGRKIAVALVYSLRAERLDSPAAQQLLAAHACNVPKTPSLAESLSCRREAEGLRILPLGAPIPAPMQAPLRAR